MIEAGPMTRLSEAPAMPAGGEGRGGRREVQPARMPSVLFVDSSAVLQQLVGMALEVHGYWPVCRGSLSSALGSMSDLQPLAVVVSDQLADGSGSELARRLRSEFGYAGMIVLTVRETSRPTTWTNRPEGVDCVLQRPFTSEALFATLALAKVIARSRGEPVPEGELPLAARARAW